MTYYIFFPISNTLFLLPPLLSLWTKDFVAIYEVLSHPPRGFYELASSIFIKFLIFSFFFGNIISSWNLKFR